MRSKKTKQNKTKRPKNKTNTNRNNIMTSLKMEIGNNSKSGHLERKKQIIKVLKN